MKKIFVFLVLVMLAGVTGCKQEEDPILSNIDNAITDFISNYANDYLSAANNLNYYVVSAVDALEDHGYNISLSTYINPQEVEEYFNSYEYKSIGEIFKAIVICNCFGVDYDAAKEALEELKDVDIYSYAYALIALKIAGLKLSMQEELVSKILIIREEDYRDPDYAGISLLATADYDIDRGPLFALFVNNISEDGVISMGNANSCSTASVILGLLALDIDPTSSNYTKNEDNLITALLKYCDNGAFKYTLDGEVDLLFSTPQAFSALVGYKIYSESGQAFNLFL